MVLARGSAAFAQPGSAIPEVWAWRDLPDPTYQATRRTFLMAPKFGTSGLRGLVTELTPPLIRDHTRAFLTACGAKGSVHVGQDLRASSPHLAAEVMAAVTGAGLDAVDHGALPTPALALAAMTAGEAAIMVTGSHIPADRNGLKFYKAAGEIDKADEAAILAGLSAAHPAPPQPGRIRAGDGTLTAYGRRYMSAFGPAALEGLRIGVYEHSSVARDILAEILTGLGAEAIRLARSDSFVPVDTEAVDAGTRAMLADWCRDHDLDALVSTDGDADRPMVTDADGVVVPGDVLGPLTARHLKAETIVTPVSSNTLVDAMGFGSVTRTRIGSPYVIAGMEAAGAGRIVGYEANGGFLLGFEAMGPTGPIAPLMTRDCLLPIVTPLVAMREAAVSLAGLVAGLPQRFTASDRLTDIPTARSQAWLQDMIAAPETREAVLANGAEVGIDLTDGLRVTYRDGTIIHLRPSGNAPEFRCYTEADSAARADTLLQATLAILRSSL